MLDSCKVFVFYMCVRMARVVGGGEGLLTTKLLLRRQDRKAGVLKGLMTVGWNLLHIFSHSKCLSFGQRSLGSKCIGRACGGRKLEMYVLP